MKKYSFILILLMAIAGNLQAQTVTSTLMTTKLTANFKHLKDVIPDMESRYDKGDLRVTAAQSNDTTVTFLAEERGPGFGVLVDNEKEFKKSLSTAAKDADQPSLLMLYKYALKGKKSSVPPPKKMIILSEYALIWKVTIVKKSENEANMTMAYQSFAPDFSKEIDKEFEGDVYYKNKITNIAVNDQNIRKILKDILIKEFHVDQEYPAPSYPSKR